VLLGEKSKAFAHWKNLNNRTHIKVVFS
jgi:hypothetical protein